MRSRFDWVGGDLSLDFVNTVAWDTGQPCAPKCLCDYADLVEWAQDAGIVDEAGYACLRQESERRPQEAVRVFDRALTLRSTIHQLFSDLAGQTEPDRQLLQSLNHFMARMPLRVAMPGAARFDWGWATEDHDLDQVLWQIVWSAAALLNSAELPAVKECAGNKCGYLFVDESRRKNRRWCSMKECGNRVKVRRHYYRHRKQ